MFAVSVEFLHGTFRGDPDGTANTGRQTHGEWPPSPARLFAALVAADGTKDACRVTDGTELKWFEQLPPPVIHADPVPVHQPLRPRFIVQHTGTFATRRNRDVSTHHEYVGRSSVASRPGVRVTPRSPRVIYHWEVEPPDGTILEALRLRAARVGYLGSSDSPVRARVATESPVLPENTGAFVPGGKGDAVIHVTHEGDLARWDRLYAEWVVHGASVRRSHSPALAHPCSYRSPLADEQRDCGEVVAWLRLGTAVSGRRISALTTLFKAAVLNRHQEMYGEPPALLHGHGFSGTGYELARYLALPDVGFERSRGRIHGLALWLPPESDSTVRRMARDAALSIPRLHGRGVDVAVTARDDEDRLVAARPDRWLGPSRGWATAIPAIHERRRRLDLAEVTRWCEHAGLPAPVDFRSERTPLVTGGIDLAPVEVNRPGRPGLPYSHVAIRFERAVHGPVAIGAGRSRGFGLCMPLDERA